MRNILRYKVNNAEVVENLKHVLNREEARGLYGDMAVFILHDILYAAEHDPKWFYNTFYDRIGYDIHKED